MVYYFVRLSSLDGNGTIEQFGVVTDDFKILLTNQDIKTLAKIFVDKYGSEDYVIGYDLHELTVKQDGHLYTCGPTNSSTGDEFEKGLGELEKKCES